MKGNLRLLLPVLAVLMDGAAVAASAWVAYAVRFSEWLTRWIPIVTALPPLDWYTKLSIVHSGITILFLLEGGLYRFPRQEGRFEEAAAVMKRYTVAFMFLLAMLFFYRSASFSRLAMVLLFLVGAATLLISRMVGRVFREWLYRHGYGVRRAALAGSGGFAEEVTRHINRNPQYGLVLCGTLGGGGTEAMPRLGGIEDAGQAAKLHAIDTILVAPGEGEEDTLKRLIKACYGVNVDFLYLPNLLPENARPRRVVDVGGTPLWALKESPFQGWPGVVKRTFDFLVAGAMLILTSPLLLVIAAAVKFDSRGPVFYRQLRVGQDGREFYCLKFRSMRVDAEAATGAVFATPGDSRVTRVGRFLRRWTLDELPQLWNVLKGEMSIVGPRPERPEFVRQFERRYDGYQERHRVRAGMTGWAQVNGLRGDGDIGERTRYDRFYVENWSLLFDLKIILLTVAAVIKGENSY